MKTFFDFTVKDIREKEFPLTDLKGKKILVVNTASNCKFTPQYKELQKLYEKYKDKNFVIIAFPSNDFGAQEPGSNDEIAQFCKINYGVTFPIMSKVTVQGEKISPIFKWLTDRRENGVKSSGIGWNFHKFLIDEAGGWVTSLNSSVSPTSPEITDWIEGTRI